MLKSVVLLVLACSLVVGCDDDGDGAAMSGAVGDYCAAQCSRADECGELLGTVEQCESSCARYSGRLAKDRPCLFTEECIHGHETLSCEQVAELGVPEACEKSCE
jgi:hypothetical protein